MHLLRTTTIDGPKMETPVVSIALGLGSGYCTRTIGSGIMLEFLHAGPCSNLGPPARLRALLSGLFLIITRFLCVRFFLVRFFLGRFFLGRFFLVCCCLLLRQFASAPVTMQVELLAGSSFVCLSNFRSGFAVLFAGVALLCQFAACSSVHIVAGILSTGF